MHTTVIVEVKELSDGAMAVRLRCCDDPLTDSWHTLSNLHLLDDAALQAWIDSSTKLCCDTHESKLRAKAFLTKLCPPIVVEN